MPNDDRSRWEFRWFLETPDAVLGFDFRAIERIIDFVLNEAQQSWRMKASVYFKQVAKIENSDVVVRITDAPLVSGQVGVGFYYHDPAMGRNVAQVTKNAYYWGSTDLIALIIGHEFGHAAFRIHDMYLHEHGSSLMLMSANTPWPTEAEAADVRLWLAGQAPVVHPHNVLVPPAIPGLVQQCCQG
jgi:hypothetical protein